MSDDFDYPRLSGMLFGQPLLVTVEAAEVVGTYLRARTLGLEPRATGFIGEEQRDPHNGKWKGYRKSGSVGIVSIIGELVTRGSYMGAPSGLASYDGIVEQVGQAAADPDVRSILLDIHSPGGQATGMTDKARLMRAAADGKRIVAVASPMAASAAYGLAAVADEVVVNESGMVGSIGIVTVHFDQSRRMENFGVKATVIATGSKKMIGNPFEPLSEEAHALLSERAHRTMKEFVKLLTDHRPQLSTDTIDALQGDVLIGSDAVDAGLADAVGTFESVLTDLSRGPSGRSTSRKRETPMSEKTGTSAADKEAGITQAEHDAAIEAAKAEARAEAQAEADAKAKEGADKAVAAERNRLAGLDAVLAKAGPAATEMVNAFKADGKTSPEAAAHAILMEGKHVPSAVLTALQGDDAGAEGVQPAPAAETPTNVPQNAEGWKAEWEAAPEGSALRKDFTSAEGYVAYQKAVAEGRVKVLKSKAG